MICGCGYPAYLFNEEQTYFYCDHCDRFCPEPVGECELCKEHYKFDAEKTRTDYFKDLDGDDVED
jgi:predicted ATP-dependent serine protease